MIALTGKLSDSCRDREITACTSLAQTSDGGNIALTLSCGQQGLVMSRDGPYRADDPQAGVDKVESLLTESRVQVTTEIALRCHTAMWRQSSSHHSSRTYDSPEHLRLAARSLPIADSRLEVSAQIWIEPRQDRSSQKVANGQVCAGECPRDRVGVVYRSHAFQTDDQAGTPLVCSPPTASEMGDVDRYVTFGGEQPPKTCWARRPVRSRWRCPACGHQSHPACRPPITALTTYYQR